MLLLTATFLKVLNQTVKLIITAIIIRHPELSDKKGLGYHINVCALSLNSLF